MRPILVAHAARYPHWAVDDLYKLLHQAALGSEHALVDEAHVRDWLLSELASLGPGPDEPLVDPISPGGDVVRVHLRPFARLGVQYEVLLGAFIRTAREYRGAPEQIAEYGQIAVALAREGQLPFSGDEVSAYVARMEQAGFPAVHHSPTFEAEYQPAYRVVARHAIPEEIIATA